jgi:hypothetical protein
VVATPLDPSLDRSSEKTLVLLWVKPLSVRGHLWFSWGSTQVLGVLVPRGTTWRSRAVSSPRPRIAVEGDGCKGCYGRALAYQHSEDFIGVRTHTST